MSEDDSTLRNEPAERGLGPFIKEIYRIWLTERPTQFAAALAYYAIFSFVPVIYIAITVANLFLGRLVRTEDVYAQVTNLLGEELASALQDAVISLGERTTSGTTLTSLIAFLVLAFTASLIFFQLQHVLNTLWQVPPPKRGETENYIRNRLLAFAMVLGVVLFMIVLVIVSAAISVIDAFVNLNFPISVGSIVALGALVALAIALIFKFLPNAWVAWRDVWPGAVVAAVLIMAGVQLLSWYLGSSRFTSALEAAGAVAIFLMAFYYMGQIFVIGALFVRVYAAMYGSGIVPRGKQSPPDEAPPDDVSSSGSVEGVAS
jgi:membrane protein